MTLFSRRPSVDQKVSRGMPRIEIGDDGLQEFGETVDNSKSQVLAKLDLHHLSRKFLAHLPNFLSSEVYLPPASLDQMIDK